MNGGAFMATIRIIQDEGSFETIDENALWCAVYERGEPRALCSGSAFSEGVSRTRFELRDSNVVTCPRCCAVIQGYRKFRLRPTLR